MLAFYNKDNVGDTLMLTFGSVGEHGVDVEQKDTVTVIKDKTTQDVIGINVFNISDSMSLVGNGPIKLTDEQINQVNDLLEKNGFAPLSDTDQLAKLVVGYVESCVPHEDSDHLSVTQTRVNNDEVLQIVCGAKNIDAGQHVIVAKPGAVMPSGEIIWAGELRGVKSSGMICSTRELDATDIEDLPGIWELNDSFEVGTPLEEVLEWYRKN
ncbi:YtpR family tRNA-binding protein [Fundicoccus sp. Sow4_H7]|uniref:YtpR family tRNA-binding protein n=1 Tax=Fundicoccus sp. Sow4_H7 TaxID=3438784 RepID=UPI003F90F221